MELSDANLLEFQLDMQKLITQREAMVADNLSRAVQGLSPAWVSGHFDSLANDLQSLHDNLVQLMDR